MLTIPDEVKTLFQQDYVYKNFRVHFPNGETNDIDNANIERESVTFIESLCSQQTFKFGLAEASQLEFTAINIPNILGVTIECAIEIDCTSLGAQWASDHPVDPTLAWLTPQTATDNGKLFYRVPYGRFEVTSCPRNHGQMAFRKVTAVTNMTLFKASQYVNGQYPTSTVKVNPYDWLNMYMGDIPLELSTSQPSSYYSWAIPAEIGMRNYISGTPPTVESLTLYGIANPVCRLDFYATPTGNQKPIKPYALKIHYEPSVMDNYADHFFSLALSSTKPSGDFTKEWDVAHQNAYGAFTNMNEQLATLYGMFKPSFFISVHYLNVTNSYYRNSKPIFIEPDKTYLIDLTHLEDFVYPVTPSSSWNVATGSGQITVSLFINVPFQWNKNGNWYTSNGQTQTISGWATGVTPFNSQNAIIRDGTLDVYLKEIEPNTDVPRGTVNATLSFNKSGLGTYYTFSNAISQLKMTEGVMEMTAEFLKVSRIGELTMYKLSDHQTVIPVAASDWEEFWWDETDIEAIGTVETLIEGAEVEESVVFNIGTGGSVYMIDDNEALRKAGWSLAEIQQLFEGPFATETAYANYTPIEMTMRGLPYLEAGDKVQMTAEDGEIVESYIMQQTITGIQYLRSSVVSMSGEPIAITEEEE